MGQAPPRRGDRRGRLGLTVLPPARERCERAIVLVHGAWVGEWSWIPVLPLLEASGRPVHAVSLTGHGALAHRSGPQVTQADHIADVIGVIRTFDLVDITLVGHSYGGRVITAVAHEIADRITRLVYLDAHAPTGPDPGQSPGRVAEAEASGGMVAFRGYDPDPAEMGGEVGVAWFLERVMPQSFATLTPPMRAPLPGGIARSYVVATGYRPTRFAAYAQGARTDPAWEYLELPGSHWVMFSHPREVADIILA